MSPAAQPLLEVRQVSKTFGQSRVLDNASLTVEGGQIHGLLGQNGSGKSTLIRILSGFHAPDPGADVRVRGEEVDFPLRAGQSYELGLSFVHQDLGLVPTFTVVENLLLGSLARKERRSIRLRRERVKAREVLDSYGVKVNPERRVSELSGTERALVAIVRAVEDLAAAREDGRGRSVLVLDEPTAFLPREGVELLFALVRSIAAEGVGVLFVSHDLAEVRDLTDEVTVLFNGRVAGTVRTAAVDERDLITLIVGRELEGLGSSGRAVPSGEVTTTIAGAKGGTVRDVSLDLHRGEIVGVTGLIGSGFEALPYVLFGAGPERQGTVVIEGESHELANLTPPRAVRAGIALIPADRAVDGSIGELSVADNMTMATLPGFQGRLRLDRRRLLRSAHELAERYGVVPPDPQMPYAALSGGNQQKVLLAKWLETHPRLLLLHEPTQGVDVGARENIYAILRSAAKDGTAILCASSDHDELALICDRVLVIAQGKPVCELVGDEITKERIGAECLTGGQPLRPPEPQARLTTA
jgi:ribose transport system ATP-binding protein